MCVYVTLYSKRDFADVVKSGPLRWEDYIVLSKWAPYCLKQKGKNKELEMLSFFYTIFLYNFLIFKLQLTYNIIFVLGVQPSD